MTRFETEIEFFKWFEYSGQMGNQKDSLQVLINKWHTKNAIIESSIPPLEGISIPYRDDIIQASPFKKAMGKDTALIITADINRVLEQNNYTNQLLYVVAKQIERSSKGSTSIGDKPCTSKYNPHIEANPIFKIPEFSRDKFPKLTSQISADPEILEQINDQLMKLKLSSSKPTEKPIAKPSSSKPTEKPIAKPSGSKPTENPGTSRSKPATDKIGMINESKEQIHYIKTGQYHNKKNFYARPYFPDMQFEENVFLSSSSNDVGSITEWNIDGLAEHQIYNNLHEMEITITAYKLRKSGDKHSAHMLIAGFTGMFQHWWDNYLSEEEKNKILEAVTYKKVIKTENEVHTTAIEPVEDATATLLYCIAKHFIGEPKLFQDRSLEILNNLHCKKLGDFKWYKDMFIQKVMIRVDCNNDFWKERFISRLPPLFAEKVRTKIRDRCEGKIPYEHLTYGDLASITTVVAFELCTDLKLKEQLKIEKKLSSSELESFCQDFDFPNLPHLLLKEKKRRSQEIILLCEKETRQREKRKRIQEKI